MQALIEYLLTFGMWVSITLIRVLRLQAFGNDQRSKKVITLSQLSFRKY